MRVTALIKGGMGNQLFIYAAARQVVADLEQRGIEADLHLDTSFYLFDPRYRMECEIERLGLPYDGMSASWIGLARQKAIRVWEQWGRATRPGTFGVFPEADPRGYAPILGELEARGGPLGARGPRGARRSIVISGYRQNIAYFDGGTAVGEIRRELDASAPALQGMSVAPDDVCLHVRVLYSLTGNTFNPDRWRGEEKDFFVRAATTLNAERSVGTCWIFGDHPETQEDLATTLQARGLAARAWRSEFQEDALSDFHRMRRFRRFVVGDSTFAWWAAYLASGVEAVLLPREVYSSRSGQVFAACRLA